MQNYSTIMGVIQSRQAKIPYEEVQRRFGIGASTVTRIMKRFADLETPLEDLKKLEPKKVELIFYPPENLRDAEKPLPDFEAVHRQMLNMDHPDLAFVWLEYKQAYPDGYQLSQFYKLYSDYLKENYHQDTVKMPVERIPRERMYIDWVGDQPALLANPATGELQKVHIFATTLGFSSCVYAEIFPNEKTPNFIAGVVHALEFYHAVPKFLIPDNLKAAISKHSKDELVLNSIFSDLEDFYDVVVLPPPPRKPRGKATVENHVRFLEVHLVERLKEKIYTSFEALNEETKKIIVTINQGRFQRVTDIRKTRQYAFETYDLPRMRPLPDGHFNTCDYKYFLHVPENYHLEYDGHYYSVLYTHHGKPAILKATMTQIQICDENNRLLCEHIRSYKEFPRYITDDSHMPPEHKYYKELNAHDGDYYRRWANTYGTAMHTLIDRILRSPKHEEQAYNSCKGILHMVKDVPYHVVEAAAQKCIDASMSTYSSFKRILSDMNSRNKADLNPETLPTHENIRGKEAFK